MVQPSNVYADCSHPYTLNATFEVKCNTKEFIPPPLPDGHTCGTNYCYDIPIYPSDNQSTEWKQSVYDITGSEKEFNLYFIPKEHECHFPQITVDYEPIDYEESYNYFDVFDNSSVMLNRCGAGKYSNLCGANVNCLVNYLEIDIIGVDDMYLIKLATSNNGLDALCNHPYSINATVIMECHAEDHIKSKCLSNINCFDIQIYPSINDSTEWKKNVYGLKSSFYPYQTIIDIYLTSNINKCYSPAISIDYEPIDYGYSGRYFDVFDYNSTLLHRCGNRGDTYPRCGQYVNCFDDKYFTRNQFISGETYHFQMVQTANIYQYCNRPYNLNTTMTLKCNTKDFIPPPLPDGHTCGTNTNAYCYEIPIYPSKNESTEWKQTVYDITGTEKEFILYFTPEERDCYFPSINVDYESIDYQDSYKYFDVFDDSSVLLYRCGTADIPDLCGVNSNCFANNYLEIDSISIGDTYQINLVKSSSSWSSNAKCEHPYSINATVIMECNTKDHIKPICPSNINCNEIQIYPSANYSTEWKQNIYGLRSYPSQNSQTPVDIYMTSKVNKCYFPSISIDYEPIDYSWSDDYFDVYDYNSSWIYRCGDASYPNSCSKYVNCLQDKYLILDTIDIDQTYTIQFIPSNGVYPRCNHPYTINATITIKCHTKNFIKPTEPNYYLCAPDTYCYDIEIYPSNNMTTQWEQIIKSEHTTETTFDLYFTSKQNECRFPSITMDYERIDYHYSSRYIDVFDNTEWAYRCGAGSYSKMCGVDATCFEDHYLDVDAIDVDDEYHIRLVKSSNYQGCSSLHPYTINATVTMKCESNDFIPPIGSPTGYICDTNTNCYDMTIYPINNQLMTTSLPLKGVQQYYVVYLKADGYNCNNPQISFQYEMVTYYYRYDSYRIQIFEGISNVLIKKCFTDLYDKCNTYSQCLSNHNLRTNQIIDGETLQIKILNPRFNYIGKTCGPYTMNASLSITCNDTIPLRKPVTDIIYQCSTDTVCYNVTIQPNIYDTEFTISVIDDSETGKYYDIYIKSIGDNCYFPTISFRHELIDFYNDGSYINIYNANNIITQCKGKLGNGNQCDTFNECLNDYALGITKIENGTTHKLSIYKSSAVDAQCYGNSINAKLTLKCKEPDLTTTTLYPTTLYPTTLYPTTSDECVSDICYFINITEFNIENEIITHITNIDHHLAKTFTIYYHNIDIYCKHPNKYPKFSLQYERIDYNSPNEYISVYDNDNNLITQCGNISNKCGVFTDCLIGYDLINANYSHSIYQITMIQSGNVNTLCEDEILQSEYSINARTKLYCQTINEATKFSSESSHSSDSSDSSDSTAAPMNSRFSFGKTISIVVSIIIWLLFVCIVIFCAIYCKIKRKKRKDNKESKQLPDENIVEMSAVLESNIDKTNTILEDNENEMLMDDGEQAAEVVVD